MSTATAKTEPPKRYQVVGEYITVQTASVGGWLAASGRRGNSMVIGLYRNALLPEDVSAEDIERLLRKGFIREVDWHV